jgi:hypothetical protein
MSRLRLRYSSTPARLYDMDNWNEFSRNGEVRLRFIYNGNRLDFTIGYTKPYKNKEARVFANVINLNQNRQASLERQRVFQEWQNRVTYNGTIQVDIIVFTYEVLNV